MTLLPPGDGAGRAPIVNAMSVDVEDYFQVSAFDDVVPRAAWPSMESRVVANTERLLAIFAEFGVRGTFFVLAWVAEQQPSLVRALAAAGHEIASHGYGHRLVYEQSPAEFREDVRRAKHILEDTSGQRVRGYRAPSYSVVERSLWALDVLGEEGYDYDASIFPIRHDRYGIPGAPRHPHLVDGANRFVEIPPSTVRLGGINLPVAGGGYFRLLPYWWTRWGLTRVNRAEHRPAVFYLHPWEIDPDQPRLAGSRLSRFRHYRNLHLTESRLRRLMGDFAFDTVGRLADAVAGHGGDVVAAPLAARAESRA
jgi:polysaccharide deacetylase family protein (PEP-CTERM system associated)